MSLVYIPIDLAFVILQNDLLAILQHKHEFRTGEASRLDEILCGPAITIHFVRYALRRDLKMLSQIGLPVPCQGKQCFYLVRYHLFTTFPVTIIHNMSMFVNKNLNFLLNFY